MFYLCNSLIYVNLYSLKINDGINTVYDSFYNINSNVKICINDTYTINRLLGNRFSSNCSDICFQENIKFDYEENKCVVLCSEDKFEYKNMCFEECPEGTFKTFISRNICLNYIPENFYLDSNSNIFKECYKTCKRCSKEGNEIINNCE